MLAPRYPRPKPVACDAIPVRHRKDPSSARCLHFDRGNYSLIPEHCRCQPYLYLFCSLEIGRLFSRECRRDWGSFVAWARYLALDRGRGLECGFWGPESVDVMLWWVSLCIELLDDRGRSASGDGCCDLVPSGSGNANVVFAGGVALPLPLLLQCVQ